MALSEQETYCPSSRQDWRKWLEENHSSKQFVWLIYYKASTKIPSLTWSEAVDEALCYGWIDSTKKTIDEKRYMQYFTRRKPSSTWSKINKDKVAQLTEEGLMTEAGLASIKTAKENGSWSLLDDVENLNIPDDLRSALNQYEGAVAFFQSQPKSIQRQMLYYVIIPKRAETRKKRIDEIVKSISGGERPERFR